VESFMHERLVAEGATDVVARACESESADVAERLIELGRQVQDDFAIMVRGLDDMGDMIGLHVSFPSGWRPEHLRRATFQGIHAPVPGFVDKKPAAQAMVRSMIDRGPFVRFVWTLSADDVLDHHPDDGTRAPLTGCARLWLRVERQITVPFADVGASLFLIRTVLQETSTLTVDERDTLIEALRVMPEDVARYKSLFVGQPDVVRLLQQQQRC
jgi:dimethylamine monooxygenase subunit A